MHGWHGGDWQIFNPAAGASDGYGQFGYTKENGGIVLSTTALVFEAGVYPEMFADFAAIVDAVTRMVDQLDEGVAGVAEPLLATKRGYLRIPIAAGSVPQELCKAVRRLPDRGTRRISVVKDGAATTNRSPGTFLSQGRSFTRSRKDSSSLSCRPSKAAPKRMIRELFEYV